MPSPTCQVKDGGGSYVATTNGVDVTAGNTITIGLGDTTGVSSWSITCIATDETSTAPAIVVNNTNKTATFTAPAAGKALRFQSKVNNGIGPNGTVVPSYTTTFVVHTLAANALRVVSFEEGIECGPFGYLPKLNSIIRGATTASSTSMSYTGNARMRVDGDIANVTTTDTTVTSIFEWTITDEAVTTVMAEIQCVKSDGSLTASYVRRVRIKRDGGAVTVGTPVDVFTDEEGGLSSCTVTIDNSTSTGRVRVTGIAATTLYWACVISRLTTTHA